MERWLKSVDAVVLDPAKETAQVTAVKTEMSRVWDETKNREAMLKHAEWWLAKDAPVEVRGHVLREVLYPLMEQVYQEKHPEDFAVAPAEVGGVEEIIR